MRAAPPGRTDHRGQASGSSSCAALPQLATGAAGKRLLARLVLCFSWLCIVDDAGRHAAPPARGSGLGLLGYAYALFLLHLIHER